MPAFNLSRPWFRISMTLATVSLVSAYRSFTTTACASFYLKPKGSPVQRRPGLQRILLQRDNWIRLLWEQKRPKSISEVLTGFEVLSNSSKPRYLCKNDHGTFTCRTKAGNNAGGDSFDSGCKWVGFGSENLARTRPEVHAGSGWVGSDMRNGCPNPNPVTRGLGWVGFGSGPGRVRVDPARPGILHI
ncbi:hypothetical protein PSTT_09436 [Puccinia striiformis]|uniref:Uncharacterized protein n=1 Tax=Puccinia striiformis TaxID=27350 RepID=A0A2S4V8I5_9BASI|nr:hypothetical protein PSTT_09436 [Puccinia striiformis]